MRLRQPHVERQDAGFRAKAEHRQEKAVAEQRSAKAEQDAAEAAAAAENAQQQHDTLAAQLEEWAQRHKAAREAATQATIERLTAEGNKVASKA